MNNEMHNDLNNKIHDKKDQEPKLINCACRNLRMTARVVTQFYDKALQDSGLKSTQFALLNDISSKKDGISVNELARYSMMDQTTVTRNIDILRKNGYVEVKTQEQDSRKKNITVSDVGKEKLKLAAPLWKNAQLKLQQSIGAEQYKVFLETLSLLQELE
jgi:DNA-binding MarR family transcriptional regulator